MSSSSKQLENLTQAIEKLLAKEVAQVLPVTPIAPIAPIAPIIPANSGDHDLLTRLEENVTLNFKQVKDAIQELGDGTKRQIEDHEKRITGNSNDLIKIKTQQKVWGVALGMFLTLLEIIAHYVFKS